MNAGGRCGRQCCPSTINRSHAAMRIAIQIGARPAPCFLARAIRNDRIAARQPSTYLDTSPPHFASIRAIRCFTKAPLTLSHPCSLIAFMAAIIMSLPETSA